MIVIGIVVAVGLLLLFRRRAKRAQLLAGLEATRPTFTVTPPTLRLGSRKDEGL